MLQKVGLSQLCFEKCQLCFWTVLKNLAYYAQIYAKLCGRSDCLSGFPDCCIRVRDCSIKVSWSYFREVWKISQEALKTITDQGVLM